MKISFKNVTTYTYPDKYTVVEFYEETEETREIYLFKIFKAKRHAILNYQQKTIVGLKDGFYHEGEREKYQPELLAKLESKSLRQVLKEKTTTEKPGFTTTNYYFS